MLCTRNLISNTIRARSISRLITSKLLNRNADYLIESHRLFSNSTTNMFTLSRMDKHIGTMPLDKKPRTHVIEVFESSADAVKDITSESSMLVGGFGLVGVPENLIRALSQRPDVKDLIVISNEGGNKNHGLDLLLHNRQIKRMICSFIGQNKEFSRQFLSGELEVELVPQGTLVERIRCSGSGIPGFYTPTGVNTLVHLGGEPIKFNPDGTIKIRSMPKESKTFNGMTYVLEEAIHADYALIKAWKADKAGNLIFRKTANNFNHVMAKAARVCIVEVEELVEIGELDPNFIHVSGLYVDRLVKGENYEHFIEKKVVKSGKSKEHRVDPVRERIARRAALEFQTGTYANLGIGLPELVADYIPSNVKAYLQAENGILGMGPYPSREEDVDCDVINPGKETVTIVPGGSFLSSDESFSMIRGHHLNFTMLGAMQVSQYGDLANWMIPGKLVKGMGGAMDLVGNGKGLVIVLTTLLSKNGEPKISSHCTLPLTGYKVVDMIITDKCVFSVSKDHGLTLTEIAEDATVDEIRASVGCEFKVSPDLIKMPQI